MFPTAVAAASAREADLDKIQMASALPRLREGPTVPEEVQIPRGLSFGPTVIPIFRLRGELSGVDSNGALFRCYEIEVSAILDNQFF